MRLLIYHLSSDVTYPQAVKQDALQQHYMVRAIAHASGIKIPPDKIQVIVRNAARRGFSPALQHLTLRKTSNAMLWCFTRGNITSDG